MSRTDDHGGGPARRAIVRWAWRMFRREWRQQLLVLSLLTVAVAVAVCGLAVAYNAVPLRSGEFGAAEQRIQVESLDPDASHATVAAVGQALGPIEVVRHGDVTLPGSTDHLDVRAQAPDGRFGAPMLGVREGRYPQGAGEVALTGKAAAALDATVGGPVDLHGTSWSVVGLVENPADLDDQFALVDPSADLADSAGIVTTRTTILLSADDEDLAAFQESVRDAGGLDGLGTVEQRGQTESSTAVTVGLAVVTVVLLLVALVAAAAFVVIAQRRLRQLGLLAASGATDRHLRLVMITNGAVVGVTATLVGTALGLLAWLAVAPGVEVPAGHRIDRLGLPWGQIGLGMVLGTVTATAAAWWPARSVARIPITEALAARTPRAQVTRRSATSAVVLMVVGPVAIAQAHRLNPFLLITGTLATTVGVLLLSPTAVRALAACGGRMPVAWRLAVRDLGRYQARSGAALAAISLGLGIPIAIVVGATAAEPAADEGNLADSQLLVLVEGTGVDSGFAADRTPAQLDRSASAVDQIADDLGGADVVALEMAYDPTSDVETNLEGGGEGHPIVTLGEPIGDTMHRRELYVATPEVLRYQGIDPASVAESTDVLALARDHLWPDDDRTPTGGLEVVPPTGETFEPQLVTLDTPAYTQAPISLITPAALSRNGWEPTPAGWLVDAGRPLTTAETDRAQDLAATTGLTLSSRDDNSSLTMLRSGATAAGMLVALAILAMTVILIRGESAGETRALTAAGATSMTRRTITGVTAGGLALLGVGLAIVAAYLALAAGYADDLDRLQRVPFAHLLVIALGVPTAAAVCGWLASGHQPGTLSRQRTE